MRLVASSQIDPGVQVHSLILGVPGHSLTLGYLTSLILGVPGHSLTLGYLTSLTRGSSACSVTMRMKEEEASSWA